VLRLEVASLQNEVKRTRRHSDEAEHEESLCNNKQIHGSPLKCFYYPPAAATEPSVGGRGVFP
jgi:hypothetical protein